MMNEAALSQRLCYSNFLITISTNVVPATPVEEGALADWLKQMLRYLFLTWDLLNGTVLKPAGSENSEQLSFPEPHQILSVKSRIAVERGGEDRKGQVHAHVLLEVAHTYRKAVNGNAGLSNEGTDVVGVHVNVWALRNWLNRQVYALQLDEHRKPKKIYVNSKLLTSGTDNSNKWLTLQYISKDRARDNGGGVRNLRADQLQAPKVLQDLRPTLLHAETTELKNDDLDAELAAFFAEEPPPVEIKRKNPSRSTRGPQKFK
jgi:hypothetical protein